MKPHLPLFPRFLFLILLALPLISSAQPRGSGGGVEVIVRTSYTAESDLDRAGTAVSVQSWQLGLGGSVSLSEATRLRLGAEWARHELDVTGPRWLPERLQSVAIPIGLVHRWDDGWSLLATLQPRFASAGSSFSSSGFDMPVLALASYRASPELTWSFGLRYSDRSDVKLLPLAGVMWRFAPGWEAGLAFPESGVSYRATPRLTWRAVATFHGGDYRLERDPRPPADRTGVSLRDAWLEYREIRTGVAVEVALNDTMSLRADAGVVVDQRFDYFTRGVELEGESPAYVVLRFVGRF
ncbi:DUF6268 family outer membrane beta-barrel protein [Opitutus terrae]|uniref:DUF6268 domain-containing protein n=1 Tax=Opitutus terrae (strain DSM 11246 / JCM 15787 / PB90-1) TaxID=452637 RepID=B1ZNG4_OPITP|nr:DUF6268 family outer membrane beta-barrel protein [Opitutus terrae]ACB74398.1 hypothetical protein Oter_1110 [Opitutus terrae PB90-1]